ncbi:MAG: hypothetical protein A3F16_08670 [Deltaproteobacteria bacterium RIFCSPHIGHO2_12_FULL_43_9]|nr:MAG: hypothetical protein A3F16_08670 [Deltaproteobacteria bacterium RIFCSPHIGHO2_12_FULL_43_9]
MSNFIRKKVIVVSCFVLFLFISSPLRAEFTSPLIGPERCGDITLSSNVDVLDALFAAQVAVFSLTGAYLPFVQSFIAGGGVPTIDEALASCINGDTDSSDAINVIDALFMAQFGVGIRIPQDGNCPNTDVCAHLPGEACLNMYGYSQAAVTGAFCQEDTEPCSAQCQPIDPNNWSSFLAGLSSTFTILGTGRGCSAGPQSAPLQSGQCFVGTIGNPDVLYRDLSDLRPGVLPDSCFTYGGCVNAVINATLRTLPSGAPTPVFSCWYSDADQNPIDFVFCRQP